VRIAIIGSGYVGLVSGACFADFGHIVTCVDKDAAKIAAMQGGNMPIYEPGLAILVETNVREERLTFSTDLAETERSKIEKEFGVKAFYNGADMSKGTERGWWYWGDAVPGGLMFAP
jgi:2-polyprenyl-6-methoxyphenol hydroxylase-like FAD-dependent oxidoreductase